MNYTIQYFETNTKSKGGGDSAFISHRPFSVVVPAHNVDKLHVLGLQRMHGAGAKGVR